MARLSGCDYAGLKAQEVPPWQSTLYPSYNYANKDCMRPASGIHMQKALQWNSSDI